MPRSTFALKFKQTVGASPMEYLTRRRRLLAGDKLVNSSDPVSVIARSLGCESASAFNTAFRRVMGCSPRQYGCGGQHLAENTRAKQREAAGWPGPEGFLAVMIKEGPPVWMTPSSRAGSPTRRGEFGEAGMPDLLRPARR